MKLAEKRFWAKVDKRGDADCWLWTAGKHSKGYGHFCIHSKMEFAHRFAYQLLIGTIPEELEIDHLCRNRACVNPAHMELVTMRENIRRGEVGQYLRRKTHCPQGHPYDLLNTYFTKEGWRKCRNCRGRLPDFLEG